MKKTASPLSGFDSAYASNIPTHSSDHPLCPGQQDHVSNALTGSLSTLSLHSQPRIARRLHRFGLGLAQKTPPVQPLQKLGFALHPVRTLDLGFELQIALEPAIDLDLEIGLGLEIAPDPVFDFDLALGTFHLQGHFQNHLIVPCHYPDQLKIDPDYWLGGFPDHSPDHPLDPLFDQRSSHGL